MPAQREWFEKDYYQVLGVPSTATDKEITRAYRKLAKQYHPDANPGSEDRFKEISAAYDVLGDPATRKEYDEVRRLGPMAGGFGGARARRRHVPGGGPGRPGRPLRRPFGGGRPPQPSGPQRGADVEAELHLSFEDAVRGRHHLGERPPGLAVPHLQRDRRGARAPSTHVCDRCNGAGHARRQPGPVLAVDRLPQVQRPRHAGRHAVPDLPRHRHRAPQPPGEGPHPAGRGGRPADPGEGPGRARPGDGPARGPLRHRARRRPTRCSAGAAANLTFTVPITFPEAALGTVDHRADPGRPGEGARSPPGTAPGDRAAGAGPGDPGSDATGAKPGDLLVKVDVWCPTSLTDEQRAAVESLAEVTDAGAA